MADLHSLCYLGEPDLIKDYLLRHTEEDLNARDEEGNTPLFCACWNGLKDAVKVLVQDPRVDINAQDCFGATALYVACLEGYLDTIKVLLASPQRVIVVLPGNKFTASSLVAAKESGAEEAVKLLEAYIANPDKIRAALRRELGLPVPTASIFAQCIFLCDGLLTLEAGSR